MRLTNKKSGFTLLEIIIVIIIVGVLASLALPRFFSTVEFSKSTEALANISSIRQAIERCGTFAGTGTSADYTNCGTFDDLDIENPENNPGARFEYAISSPSTSSYTITATRNTADGGDGSSTITLLQNTDGSVERDGTVAFSGIN